MREHGTRAMYKHGCRCEPCRRAERDAKRRQRGSTLAWQPIAGQQWRQDAACKTMGPDIFYPTSDSHSHVEARWAQDRALAVCRRCPVAESCLHDALARRDEHGIWGGTTPDDRQSLRRIRRRLRELREAG